MKLLLDENLPHEFRHFLTGHTCYTVKFPGWVGLRNGLLLRKAAEEGFDAVITLDQNMTFQHNLATLPVAIVRLKSVSSKPEDLRLLVPGLLDASRVVQPRIPMTIEPPSPRAGP